MAKLPGHSLSIAGAPYRLQSGKWLRWSKDGGGHGMCQCGQVSGFETSTRARQRWHKDHLAIESSETEEVWTPERITEALRASYTGPIEVKVRHDVRQGRLMIKIAWDDLIRLVDGAVEDWPLDNPDICQALIRYLEHAEQLAGIARSFDTSNVSGRA